MSNLHKAKNLDFVDMFIMLLDTLMIYLHSINPLNIIYISDIYRVD